MAVFHCPACNYLKTVDDKHLGRSADCPKCKARGTICDPRELLSSKINGKPIATAPDDHPLVEPSPRDFAQVDASVPPARELPPREPVATSLGKAMGKCPECGEVTFDLGDHYARKHSHGTGIVSGTTGASATDDTLATSRAAVPDCAVPTPRKAMGTNALYVKARNVNEGMHRFHKYTKLAAYGFVGFALWANDLADNWVGYLCNKVDNATQSTLWSWTFGLLSSPPPAITPLYRWYNFIMTIIGFIGIIWFSRWFFWTTLMMKLEDQQQPYKKGDVHTLMRHLYGWWLAEYVVAGGLANLLFSRWCPFAIPWALSFTAFAMAITGAVTVGMLEDSHEDLHADDAIKPKK